MKALNLELPVVSTATDTVEFELKSQQAIQLVDSSASTQITDTEYNHPALRNPSEWIITSVTDNDDIIAYNNTTRHTFEGSISELNEILRG